MFEEGLGRELHRFGNRFFGDTPVPFVDNGFLCHATGDLFQHIFYENACTLKRRLTMTYLGISDDITPEQFGSIFSVHHVIPFLGSILPLR